ncbi:hypothetical protein [Chitinophaga sp. CF418]|uniref:hypothetical protein n=1 Tax=Chitinophaga sp. CF418 TaxID=1855287 RepID=UPI000919AD04|nr:hypothetical protein [Chitinophaga sp. CF418]SHN36384.1 hypothetical protein SAMN05216311_11091 [Chitinophaga sp. CF418]
MKIPKKTQLIILLIANFLLLLWTFANVLGEPISERTGIIAIGLVSAAALFSFNRLMMYFWDKY